MQLSSRLQAVADMAQDAVSLADIGTDHGYVPIYLMLEKHLSYAVAMDIHKGPLQRAGEHIRSYQLQDKIVTRLSDGAEKLKEGEVDTVVIAGMGGALTVRILKEGARTLQNVRLVLQPQSEIEMVRRFLHAEGFRIVAENMVKDDGKYYPMMKAVPGRQQAWEDVEYRYGKFLLEQKNPCLLEAIEKEERICRRILDSIECKTGAHIRKRVLELQHRLELMKSAKERLLW